MCRRCCGNKVQWVGNGFKGSDVVVMNFVITTFGRIGRTVSSSSLNMANLVTVPFIGRVAQWLRRLTTNQEIPSSILGPVTIQAFHRYPVAE